MYLSSTFLTSLELYSVNSSVRTAGPFPPVSSFHLKTEPTRVHSFSISYSCSIEESDSLALKIFLSKVSASHSGFAMITWTSGPAAFSVYLFTSLQPKWHIFLLKQQIIFPELFTLFSAVTKAWHCNIVSAHNSSIFSYGSTISQTLHFLQQQLRTQVTGKHLSDQHESEDIRYGSGVKGLRRT